MKHIAKHNSSAQLPLIDSQNTSFFFCSTEYKKVNDSIYPEISQILSYLLLNLLEKSQRGIIWAIC